MLPAGHALTALLLVAALLMLSGCPKSPPDDGAPAVRQETKVPEIVRDNTGLPVRIELPAEAHGADELDLLPPTLSTERTNWLTGFHYDGGFNTIVAAFDEQLKSQGYSRLSGPDFEADADFGPESNKPTRATGKRVWISGDRMILVFLTYSFTRATDTVPERNDYQLSVVRNEKQPVEINAPNGIVSIP